jgi:hypothetical protein
MTRPLTDVDMLRRALAAMERQQCEFFACPGPEARPVPMASCHAHYEAYLLRRYLKRRHPERTTR